MNEKRNSMRYILLASGLLFLWGCSSNDVEPSPYEEVNSLDNVKIELEQDEYDSEGDTFILNTVNESEDDISYGIAYTLEKEEDNTWFLVEPDEEIAFILIAHILGSGEEAQEELNMEYYEPLDTAKYRVVREIEGEVLTAEFEAK